MPPGSWWHLWEIVLRFALNSTPVWTNSPDGGGGWQFIRRLKVVNRVLSSLLGPVDLSFRALSGRLKFTVRGKDSFAL